MHYQSILTPYETQTAIGRLKRFFEDGLGKTLNLHRVSAPLFVEPHTGFNDDLSGKERPVAFDVPGAGDNAMAHIVHSLAKWKRVALQKYGFMQGEGLYTDMNAIRRDEVLDSTHSIYVDQWDWEKIITREDRHLDYIKDTVSAIMGVICDTQDYIHDLYPSLAKNGRSSSQFDRSSPQFSRSSSQLGRSSSQLHPQSSRKFSRDVVFVTAQQLEDQYPNLSPEDREEAFTGIHKTVCVLQIGSKLKSGTRHGSRAPDYDDWQLNADLIIWSDVLNQAVEISSMGIRVDESSLAIQLDEAGCNNRRELLYHKMLLGGKLPLTIGGGIGQSRLSMLILKKAHIGEVQVSVWDEDTMCECDARGVMLL